MQLWNLAPLSRRCHRATTGCWQVRRHPDGSSTWTDRGRSYPVPPYWLPPPAIGEDTVCEPDADADPVQNDDRRTLVEQISSGSGVAPDGVTSATTRTADDEPPSRAAVEVG